MTSGGRLRSVDHMKWSIPFFALGMLSFVAALVLQLVGRSSSERDHSGNLAAIGTAFLVFSVVVGVI